MKLAYRIVITAFVLADMDINANYDDKLMNIIVSMFRRQPSSIE